MTGHQHHTVHLRSEGDGHHTLIIHSPYQGRPVRVRVQTPSGSDLDQIESAMFVLPVEAKGQRKWGDGFAECVALGLHDELQLALVGPELCQVPWYADHPSDPAIRQESHLVHAVAPALNEHLPALESRMLLGFSKSGWGAVSLLARHPELFRAAAVFDAPLLPDEIAQWEMSDIFSTPENFDHYRLERALRESADDLRDGERLVLVGYDSFRDHMQGAHALLDELEIPHRFEDGPKRDHHWSSGWVKRAATQLAVMCW